MLRVLCCACCAADAGLGPAHRLWRAVLTAASHSHAMRANPVRCRGIDAKEQLYDDVIAFLNGDDQDRSSGAGLEAAEALAAMRATARA
jgi:hypothetical protein